MIKRDKLGKFIKGDKFWLGKKRPGLKNSGAGKTMFKSGQKPWNTGTANKKRCTLCKKLYKVAISQVNRSKFCSILCKLKSAKLGDKRDNPCLDCGKLIMRKSIRCRSCANTRELSPQWQGGISFEPYSVDWTQTLKRSIRERDKYTCQICGKEPAVHVHHIDYNKKNCNPFNLVTLCKSCHPKTNNNRKYWENYFLGKE